MTKSEAPNQKTRTRPASWRRALLLVTGVPLIVLHVGLLLERAIQRETLDAVALIRWVLSIALLALLKRVASGLHSFRSPTLGVAAVLIFALIHAPALAPEPGLPLAATGLGLALSLAVLDRRCGTLSVGYRLSLLARPAVSLACLGFSLATLKDRAPPIL